jgi:hypothetical protein
MFLVSCPPVVVDPAQAAACALQLRGQAGVLTPALVLGAPVIEHALDDAELAFVVAGQLTDLRSDRLARVLCPRAGELAQIVELALAHAAEPTSHSSRWLATALRAVEHDQVLALAGRLRERTPAIDAARAARDWLAATARAADRIGLVITGDLAACARMLPADRITALVAASVTDELLGVRARLERWPARVPITP